MLPMRRPPFSQATHIIAAASVLLSCAPVPAAADAADMAEMAGVCGQAWSTPCEVGGCQDNGTISYAPIGLCVPCGGTGEICCAPSPPATACSDPEVSCSIGPDPFVPDSSELYGLALVCGGSGVVDQSGQSDAPRRVSKSSGYMQWNDSPAPALDAASSWPYELDTMFGMSMFFFEIQRAGRLPPSTRAPWRGDFKGVTDSSDGIDGGYFDAGDHLLFQLPQAYSVARIAWGTHMWWEGLAQSYFDGETNDLWARDAVKWGADFLAMTTDDTRVLLHVGDIDADHAYSGRAELYPPLDRNVRYCEFGQCSDIAGEVAAALAHSASVFRNDDTLRDEYWAKAKAAYSQTGVDTDTYTNSNDAYPLLSVFYKSSGVVSHVLFAAASMYSACLDLECGDEARYLADVEKLAAREEPDGQKKWFWPVPGWDHAWFDAAVIMLARGVHGPDVYGRPAFSAFVGDMVSAWVNGNDPVQTSPSGQKWANAWASNRWAMNAAAIMLAWADLPDDARSGDVSQQQARCTAVRQIHYVAGDNDRGSYVAGFGENPATRNHHRNSACLPWEQNDDPVIACGPVFADVVDPLGNCPVYEDESKGICYQSANRPNPLVTHGALVGGPKTPTDAGDADRTPYSADGWNDWRMDHVGSEQAMDYNAMFSVALAAAMQLPAAFWEEGCGDGVDRISPMAGRGTEDRVAETFADDDVWTFSDFEEYGWTRTGSFMSA